jgi:DNA transposition AAA+ family ATPase
MGISSATLSKVLNGDWDTISDDMWRSIAAQTGHDATAWQTVATRGFERMGFILDNAKQESLAIAVTGDAGCGKTEAVKQYTAGHAATYHLCCSEYWNRRTFIAKLLRALGKDMAGTVSEQMDAIVEELQAVEKPLIVLDEADKLSDQVLYFFISLYNQLEGQCGLVLCATSFLEKRITRGVRFNRRGYQEIYSRIGRKFVKLQVVNDEDIAAVCRANGVTSAADIGAIIKDADCDLRRVKRACWTIKKGGRA